jgi:hypothetical protein
VQVGPVGGGSEEDGVGVALDADSILAAGVDQPGLFLRVHFFEQWSDIDTGTDELEVFHEFPLARSSDTLYLLMQAAGQPEDRHANRPQLCSVTKPLFTNNKYYRTLASCGMSTKEGARSPARIAKKTI